MWESPIKITEDITRQMDMVIENGIMTAVRKVGIDVDKEELLKALQYDRGQYEKGYQDGVTDTNVGGKWIPCSERLPEHAGKYLVTTDGTFGIDVIDIARFENNEWHKSSKIIAWCSLPEPYKGE